MCHSQRQGRRGSCDSWQNGDVHGGERTGTRRHRLVVRGQPQERPKTALHGLRVGVPLAALLWGALVGVARRLMRSR